MYYNISAKQCKKVLYIYGDTDISVDFILKVILFRLIKKYYELVWKIKNWKIKFKISERFSLKDLMW